MISISICIYISKVDTICFGLVRLYIYTGLSIEPEKRPGVTNLIRIYSKCSGIAQDTAIRDFSDAGFIEFKRSVAEVVIEFLRPIQQRYNEIIKDSQYLDKVANDGVEHINSISDEVIKVFDWLF